MAADTNKALMRRYYRDVWEQGDMGAADELVARDVVDHMPMPGQGQGRAGHNDVVRQIRAAFPDMRLNVEDLVAEGDRVVGRWTMTGTHRGELMRIPATGKSITIDGIDIARVQNGQIAELWHIEDMLTLLMQIGVIPSPSE